MSKQPHLLRREPSSRGGTSLSTGDKGDVLVVKEQVLGTRQEDWAGIPSAESQQATRAARAPMKWAETKEKLRVQLFPSGHSCCITASHTTPSSRPSQTGQCRRAWGSSASGSAQAIPHQGNEQASLGPLPHPQVFIMPQLLPLVTR